MNYGFLGQWKMTRVWVPYCGVRVKHNQRAVGFCQNNAFIVSISDKATFIIAHSVHSGARLFSFSPSISRIESSSTVKVSQ